MQMLYIKTYLQTRNNFGKGLFVFQELFVVEGSGHIVVEAKDFLVPGDTVRLDVFVAHHGRCGRRVGSKWGQGQLSIVDCQSSIVESGQWVVWAVRSSRRSAERSQMGLLN